MGSIEEDDNYSSYDPHYPHCLLYHTFSNRSNKKPRLEVPDPCAGIHDPLPHFLSFEDDEYEDTAAEYNHSNFAMANAIHKKASRGKDSEVRRECPYLHTVNRQVLDLDFEKLCHVALSALNMYVCLVCGRDFQGRGPNSHAYIHSFQAGHHLFINLHSEKVYCLPEGYEVDDPCLDDIRYILNPRCRTTWACFSNLQKFSI